MTSRTCWSTTTSPRAGGGTSTRSPTTRGSRVVEGEVDDLARLTDSLAGATAVVHLASNPDIARAMTEPTIDFDQGTALTNAVVEAARRASVELMLYASGSGVYGELGEVEASEDQPRSSRSRPTVRASSPGRP